MKGKKTTKKHARKRNRKTFERDLFPEQQGGKADLPSKRPNTQWEEI
jgi:hypothetical protein